MIIGIIQKNNCHTLATYKKSNRTVGGQSHVKCEHHDVPLIASIDRSKECSCCDGKEYLTCPKIGCNSKICKKCFEELEVEEEYTVHHNIMEEENIEIDSDFDFSGSEDDMS